MSGAILLTGATGFLGMESLARLIERDEQQVFVLVRGRSDSEAQARVQAALGRLFEQVPAAAANVRAVRGDLLEPGLGLSSGDRQLLLDSVRRIIHCAASISFDMTLEQARAVNVSGTERVLELARQIGACGRLERMIHVSTSYVSGTSQGRFGEHQLDAGQGFRNTYEQSKHEAEQMLAQASDIPLAIARPSIVVGHQDSGWTTSFNVIYWPIRAFERGLLREIPASARSIVDFVPVDYVIDGIFALLDERSAAGAYNFVAGDLALSVGELVRLHAQVTGTEPARLIPEPSSESGPLGARSYAPYFDVRGHFDDVHAQALASRNGLVKPDPRDYYERLIAYAHHTRWGKRQMSRQAALELARGGLCAVSVPPRSIGR